MKIIACFSYKGGSGRTVATANIAAALASCQDNIGSITKALNRKVAIFDLDVFSAGTHKPFGVNSNQLENHNCIQDFFDSEGDAKDYVMNHGLSIEHEFMADFLKFDFAKDNCRKDLVLYPAKPDPGRGFSVGQFHRYMLAECLDILELMGYDYVLLDGESGKRSMADVALALSDVVLMFFRLTHQHVEGTVKTATMWRDDATDYNFYLIPTVVPLLGDNTNVYRDGSPGLPSLIASVEQVPRLNGLTEFCAEGGDQHDSTAVPCYFWNSQPRICVHESLTLKGGERVIVYDAVAGQEQAAKDYYDIAEALTRLHPA
ncbi:AAA family ATPase [bacterium]|nr:AAA family ATPase [bacterium]